jgi:hypothetical protein
MDEVALSEAEAALTGQDGYRARRQDRCLETKRSGRPGPPRLRYLRQGASSVQQRRGRPRQSCLGGQLERLGMGHRCQPVGCCMESRSIRHSCRRRIPSATSVGEDDAHPGSRASLGDSAADPAGVTCNRAGLTGKLPIIPFSGSFTRVLGYTPLNHLSSCGSCVNP